MESARFDALTRALSTLGSRRWTVRTLVGSALGGLVARPGAPDDAAARKKHKRRKRRRRKKGKHKGKGKDRVKGPCAPGKSKQNSCRRNQQCCTNYCRNKRCRCRLLHQSCTEDRNCCPEFTGRVCTGGTCQIQSCFGPGVACPGRLDCCPGSLCDERDGVCQPCDVCRQGCPFNSIQEAIEAAEEGDTIRLCAETFRERIIIRQNLTLIGAGESPRTGTVLDGQRSGSVIAVAEGAVVRLEGLRITEGDANDGGGIANDGQLTLVNSTVTGNTSADFGAGIANQGVLQLIGCTVVDNEALFGGGIANANAGPRTLTLTDSSVTNNRATSLGGGIHSVIGTTVLEGASSVTENKARFDGGGVYNQVRSALILNDISTVTGNEAARNGGGIYNAGNAAEIEFAAVVTLNDDSSVAGNVAGGNGGGIYNQPGVVGGIITLNDRGSVTGNTASATGPGGGIFNDDGTVTLNDNSSVTGNQPDQCGPTAC